MTVRLSARVRFILLLALGVIVLHAEDPPNELHLVLMIGQSNMAGRAPMSDAEKAPHPRAWLHVSNDVWEVASAPLNRNAKQRKNLGMQKLNPGTSFIRRWHGKNEGSVVGIVCAARGGSKIGEWSRDGKLYKAAIADAKAAKAKGTFVGVLWHQGESDLGDFSKYPGGLKKLVKNLRKDLGDAKLPIVFGELPLGGKVTNLEGRKAFNEMLNKHAMRIKHTAVAKASDLVTFDFAHFDAPSQRTLGERYAEALFLLRTK